MVISQNSINIIMKEILISKGWHMFIEISWSTTIIVGVLSACITVLGAIFYAKPLKRRILDIETSLCDIKDNHLVHIQKRIDEVYNLLLRKRR